jgi:hypothetical protein
VRTELKNEVPLLPSSEHHENALQADLLGSSVVRPADTETTALGAAYAAGLAVGIWTEKQIAELTAGSGASSIFHPQVTEDERERRYQSWNKAVERSFGLADLASWIQNLPNWLPVFLFRRHVSSEKGSPFFYGFNLTILFKAQEQFAEVQMNRIKKILCLHVLPTFFN